MQSFSDKQARPHWTSPVVITFFKISVSSAKLGWKKTAPSKNLLFSPRFQLKVWRKYPIKAKKSTKTATALVTIFDCHHHQLKGKLKGRCAIYTRLWFWINRVIPFQLNSLFCANVYIVLSYKFWYYFRRKTELHFVGTFYFSGIWQKVDQSRSFGLYVSVPHWIRHLLNRSVI